MQRYGAIIREERKQRGLSVEVLANILLMDEKALHQVEEGKEEMSDVRLTICANLFHLSKEAMVQGVSLPAISDQEIHRQLEKVEQKISDPKKEEEEQKTSDSEKKEEEQESSDPEKEEEEQESSDPEKKEEEQESSDPEKEEQKISDPEKEGEKEKKKTSVQEKEKSFAEQIDEVLAGTFSIYDNLKIGDTPQILLDVGCEQLPILYTQYHLKKVIKTKNEGTHDHGLTLGQIKSIYTKMSEPVMVFDSLTREDSVILLTDEIDSENNPVVVSLCVNGTGFYQGEQCTSNFATSIYGRARFETHINKVLTQDKLLFYDKEKSQALFGVLGLQFPECLNALDSNTIIRPSSHIVNSQPEERTPNL